MENFNNISDIKNYISDNYLHNMVEPNEETISMLDYVQLLNSYFYPLFDININGSNYIDRLNRNLKYGIHDDIDLFSKEHIKHMSRFSFDDIELSTNLLKFNNNTFLDLYLHRTIPLKRSHHYVVRVEKKENVIKVVDYLPYYTSNKESLKKCVSYSDNFLFNLLSFIDEYRLTLDKIKNSLEIKRDLFNIRIVLLDNRFGYRVIYKEPNLNNIDNQDEVADFIKDNTDLILCNIPVNISSLPLELQEHLQNLRERESFEKQARMLHSNNSSAKKLVRTKNNK